MTRNHRTPPMTDAREPLRVLVAGGGVAAAELLLALRALAGERVTLEVVARTTALPVRASAPAAALASTPPQTFDLRDVAADAGAGVRVDAVEAVASRAHRVRLASGATADYDALVLATGVRACAAVPGALTFRDHRDGPLVARAVDEIQHGRLVFTVPAGVAWTLPLYELSLLAAERFGRDRRDVETMIVTPERRALEVFGAAVSDRVEQLLEDRGVRLLRGAAAAAVQRGRLTLATGEGIAADRVVAVPRLVGRRLAGVPADWNNLVDTDAAGRVRELVDVYAAGDMTRFPVKQGGIAAQQADTVAAALAACAGAGVEASPPRPVLRSRLLGAGAPLYLRAELDDHGRPLASSAASVATGEPPWWPAAKLFARHLTPWMAARAASHPPALAV